VGVALALALMAWASPALASDPLAASERVGPKADTIEVVGRFSHDFARHHDRGLYFRFGAGVGVRAASFTAGPFGAVWGPGPQTQLELALGGFVADGFALHLSFAPSLGSVRGALAGGLGVTFYPAAGENLHVSAYLGAATPYDAGDQGVTPGGELALAGGVSLGTGLWVSDQATLGLSVFASGAHVDLDMNATLYTDWQAGARLTFTID
jgi:hypothetical protein